MGYTVDPTRRLRQHNRELRGGAWATRPREERASPWRHLFVVAVADSGEESDAFDAHRALSLEWHLKRGRGNRKGRRRHRQTGKSGNVRGVARRLELLREAVSLPKFAPFADRMVVFVDPAYVDEAFAALWDTPVCCVAELADFHA